VIGQVADLEKKKDDKWAVWIARPILCFWGALQSDPESRIVIGQSFFSFGLLSASAHSHAI
jgi:hypothetical protein